MNRENAILLLKPDSIASGYDKDVIDLAVASGLSIVCRHRTTIHPAALLTFFPECRERDLIERTLLECQYLGRAVEIILVSSYDALTRALEVRDEARKRWAMGPFSNVVHAADEPAEWAVQLRVLARNCGTCEAACAEVPDAYRSRKLPLSLRPEICDELDLRGFVCQLWEDRSSPVWQRDAVGPYVVDVGEPRTHEVVLTENYKRVSTDGLVAAINTALPGITVKAAITFALAAAHRRQYPLTISRQVQAEQMASVFSDLGLSAFVQERANRKDELVAGSRT